MHKSSTEHWKTLFPKSLFICFDDITLLVESQPEALGIGYPTDLNVIIEVKLTQVAILIKADACKSARFDRKALDVQCFARKKVAQFSVGMKSSRCF